MAFNLTEFQAIDLLTLVENQDSRHEITSINAILRLVVTQYIAIPLELALRAIRYSAGDGCYHSVAISDD